MSDSLPAEILRALAAPRRRDVIVALRSAPMTTHALAGALGITPDAVRRLLKPLTDADIITADRSSRAAVFGLARRTTVRRRGAVTEVAVTTDGNDMQIVLRLR